MRRLRSVLRILVVVLVINGGMNDLVFVVIIFGILVFLRDYVLVVLFVLLIGFGIRFLKSVSFFIFVFLNLIVIIGIVINVSWLKDCCYCLLMLFFRML